MKKICLINRKPRPEYFSIEKVFEPVKRVLKTQYHFSQIFAPHSNFTIWHLIQNIYFVSKIRADIYHVTGDAHYLALARPGNQTILTIHDCIFLENKNKIKRYFLKKILLDLPVRHVRIITTISESSKRDIVSNSGCEADKVVVIPNPVDENILYSEKQFNNECPVLLFVGTTPNKNLERVVHAISGIRCFLQIIGKITNEHKMLLERNNVQYKESFSISDSELALQYSKADLLIFPSTFEGFGLPILEAQTAGRIVITSDLSPMREVAGNGACLVDPYNVESIRSALKKILQDSDYRNDLVQKGLLNVKKYSVQETVNGYREVYEKMLS